MPIRMFELFHGGVIVKLLRSDRPITLRMIETRPAESWSTYTLNDAVDLFITYSKAPRPYSRSGGGTSWTFPFSDKQLQQINKIHDRDVYIALVCAKSNLKNSDVPVCLLKPEEIEKIVDVSEAHQSITVRLPRGRGQFRILKERKEEFLVPKLRLEKWDVPGS
ncbi:MAG: hypothetical protein JRJ62_15375 [Deltaproteobacteria bacterium]|nr:hypothetical protein [Deltaproteobacteria bacterium]